MNLEAGEQQRMTEEERIGSTRAGAGQEELICDGKYVVVERGDQQRIILFKSNQTISFGKGATQQDLLLSGAAGSPFLTAFKASPAPPDVVSSYKPSNSGGGRNKPWKKSGGGGGGGNARAPPQNLFILETSGEPVAKIINEFYQLPDTILSGTDNRHIVDDNSSQLMKKQDIESLREQGISSKEILDTIITSSKSFSQKTEYAQEKYLKKKEKIYGDVLVFHKPSIPILADYYYERDPVKVLGLRADTVSQILSYANIHAGGKYLIFDNGNGLIVAAVLQRLGGFGQALHCHIGSNPSRQALVCMNFTEKALKPMANLDMLYLLREPSSNSNEQESVVEPSEEPETKRPKLDDKADAADGGDAEKNKNGKEKDAMEVEIDEVSAGTRILRHINSKDDNERSLSILNEAEFDGLVICAKEHPLSLFQRLVPKLALSAPFVIYCQYPEPLMDCYVWAKEKGIGSNVHLVDNWFRNIQVETERTHPEIQMSPSGGYLLFGTYTDSS